MSLSDIRVQKIYPILKSYVVPYFEDNMLLDCRELKDIDVETYKRVLERLKEFIEEAFLFIEKLGLRLNDVERIELIGDMISLYFRLPLLREIISSTTLNPFKLYLYYRLFHKIHLPKD
ncbi:MAG: hypothetical protein ACP5OK_08875, partial [Thermoprotei archaeon]